MLALSNSLKELLLVVFIVLVPTVPVTIFLWGTSAGTGAAGA